MKPALSAAKLEIQSKIPDRQIVRLKRPECLSNLSSNHTQHDRKRAAISVQALFN